MGAWAMTTRDKFYFAICAFALILCLITHEWLGAILFAVFGVWKAWMVIRTL
jgi:hypothetical protein